MSPAFSIDADNYSDLSSHIGSECATAMDELVMVACGDGWSTFDHFSNFLQARNKKVRASKVFQIPGKVENMRTTGDYIHFSLPEFQHSYKVFQYVKDVGFKEASYGTQTKQVSDKDEQDEKQDSTPDSGEKGETEKPKEEQIKYLDAVFNDDLIFLLMRIGPTQIAQIYMNNQQFKLIDTINDGQILAIDMVYDYKHKLYDVYAIQRKDNSLQVVYEKITRQQINAKIFTKVQFVSKHSFQDVNTCADKLRATQQYLIVECQVKGSDSTLILERKNLTPIATGPSFDKQQANNKFYQTDIAVMEHNVDWQSKSAAAVQEHQKQYLQTLQTIVIVSKKAKNMDDKATESVTIYEMFDSEAHGLSSHVSITQVKNVKQIFKKEPQNDNQVLFISSGAVPNKEQAFQSKYFVTNWAGQSQFQVFQSCSFLQHPDPENGGCVDNPEGHFYIGLPLESGHKDKLVTCDDQCDELDNATCLRLKVICNSKPVGYLWYFIGVAILFMVILIAFSIYFYRKLQQAQAEALLMQIEFDQSNNEQSREQQGNSRHNQRMNRRRQQKETLERIKKLIRANLIVIEFDQMMQEKETKGDQEPATCGICIEEFRKMEEGDDVDEATKTDYQIVKPPQCVHLFHRVCILQWVDTNIDKMVRPDCPNCREPFGPQKANKKDVKGNGDAQVQSPSVDNEQDAAANNQRNNSSNTYATSSNLSPENQNQSSSLIPLVNQSTIQANNNQVVPTNFEVPGQPSEVGNGRMSQLELQVKEREDNSSTAKSMFPLNAACVGSNTSIDPGINSSNPDLNHQTERINPLQQPPINGHLEPPQILDIESGSGQQQINNN